MFESTANSEELGKHTHLVGPELDVVREAERHHTAVGESYRTWAERSPE